MTIECESERGHFSKTLNVTAEGILPGDVCVVRGCYEDDFYESYNLASTGCAIPRKLPLILIIPLAMHNRNRNYITPSVDFENW